MKKKKYEQPEEDTFTVNEPDAAYQPVSSAKTVMPSYNDADYPCRFSMEELIEGADEFIDDIEHNNAVFISHTDIKKSFSL